MVTNHRNKFWEKKFLEIQSYLGSKKSSDSCKFIKNIHSPINLISVDTWEKYCYKMLVEKHKEFLRKKWTFIGKLLLSCRSDFDFPLGANIFKNKQ